MEPPRFPLSVCLTEGSALSCFARQDLEVIWKQFPGWNKHNTVLVDDSRAKTTLQPMNALVSQSIPLDICATHSFGHEFLCVFVWMT